MLAKMFSTIILQENFLFEKIELWPILRNVHKRGIGQNKCNSGQFRGIQVDSAEWDMESASSESALSAVYLSGTFIFRGNTIDP